MRSSVTAVDARVFATGQSQREGPPRSQRGGPSAPEPNSRFRAAIDATTASLPFGLAALPADPVSVTAHLSLGGRPFAWGRDRRRGHARCTASGWVPTRAPKARTAPTRQPERSTEIDRRKSSSPSRIGAPREQAQKAPPELPVTHVALSEVEDLKSTSQDMGRYPNPPRGARAINASNVATVFAPHLFDSTQVRLSSCTGWSRNQRRSRCSGAVLQQERWPRPPAALRGSAGERPVVARVDSSDRRPAMVVVLRRCWPVRRRVRLAPGRSHHGRASSVPCWHLRMGCCRGIPAMPKAEMDATT